MNQLFVEALDLREHPIKKAKKKIQTEYITALTYVVEKTISNEIFPQTDTKKYISEHLHLYQTQLCSENGISTVSEKAKQNCLKAFRKPWRKKYCFLLFCDTALILFDESLILHAAEIIKERLPSKRQIDIDKLAFGLQNSQNMESKYIFAYPLISQYRTNRDFFSKKARKIIVTANVSAGKSTLINALIGKPIARTSQEICTGNICYLFNKAYEDGNVHLSTQHLNLRATADDLHSYDWKGPVFIASCFSGMIPNLPRLCIIDTPGVDASLYKDHSKRTQDALLSNDYDIIIYVVSPTRLGTDAEKRHLQWVAQHLQKSKIIFVLNKLDDYHIFSDDIEESVLAFKEDLLKIGFESPTICPISAYFSYLLKLKMTGQALSEDEADEYTLYSKKFKKSSYDLSHFYKDVQCLPTDTEEIAMSKRAGLYGLETIIYGGEKL